MRKILVTLTMLVLSFTYATAIEHAGNITFITKRSIDSRYIKIRNMEDRISTIHKIKNA
ncbi:hypothetical protein [Francisella sp. 19X1-34]|uniref:hypothetical protein n=1 Tax=Francisella sp. 19X1-34 TaxID=3087177 RepID=UPI002E35281D|nr:hypothetical protein [Francisella sp. 19X1-34]MED7789600.1 hypothetical protein [Francisella sp. 19X1-34]